MFLGHMQVCLFCTVSADVDLSVQLREGEALIEVHVGIVLDFRTVRRGSCVFV
jgi:hypothetical protein